MLYDVRVGDKIHRLEIRKVEDNWLCWLDGRDITVDVQRISRDTLHLLVDGKSFEVRRESAKPSRRVFIRGVQYEVFVQDPRSLRSRRRAGLDDAGPQKLLASMPGKVVRVLAREGDEILAGQGIIVVEAMKMQNEVRSVKPGVLKKILAREGANVNAGEVLAIVE